MTNQEMQKLTNDIQEKLGKDNSALISDVLGTLITDTENMNKAIENKEKEITDLKTRNDNLLTVNANLLLQVPMAKEEESKPSEEKKEPFDFRTVFDEKGNFKK